MGKTHLSGLEIGDRGLDIWASPSLSQKVRLTAYNAAQRMHTPEGAHITQLRVADGTGALIAATVNIGTTLHGTQIFGAAVTAGAPVSVEKYAPKGYLYVEVTTGALPLFVVVTYIAALNA